AAAIALGLIVGFVVPLLSSGAPAEPAPAATHTAAAPAAPNDTAPTQAPVNPAAATPTPAPAATAPATGESATPATNAGEPVPAATAATPADAASGNPSADRAHVIRAIATLDGVERALWSTPSNLLIYRLTEASKQDVDRICQVLDGYPELRSSRVQLQPPPGSTTRVRFFQCRAY
ncbi:MAG: hypothetical protein JF591_22785, partial [Lysobacter sp.]|nr:hypothetical protein [Lysobacter sp.]